MTSYNLLNDMNEAAYKAFEEFIPDVMNGSMKSFKQEKYQVLNFTIKKISPIMAFLTLVGTFQK